LPFNNIASSLLLERDFFVLPPGECHLSNENTCQSDVNVPVDCPSSKKYQPPLPTNLTFDGEYYGELSSSDIDCSEDKWKDTCTVDYCNRQEDAFLQANTIMSIPYIISACLSPILGGFVDRYGMRAIIATVAPAVLVVVHLLMGFTDISAVGPMVGQGLAYAGFAAVLWPSVPLVVERKLTGLGYGVMTSIQNLGLAIFPLIIAAIYTDSNSEYIPNVEIFFVSLAVLGVLVGIYLNIYDLSHNNVFNAPRAKAAQYDPLLVLDDDEEVVNLNTSDRRSASRISISSADLNR
jgi:MFS family permease